MCSELQPAHRHNSCDRPRTCFGSVAYKMSPVWSGSCTKQEQPALPGPRSGCRLLSNEIAFSVPVADAKPKRSLSPTLVVLFLFSYALLVLLVVEQSRTVMNQRVMIQQLLGDSTELTHLKVQIQQQKNAQAQPQAKTQAKK